MESEDFRPSENIEDRRGEAGGVSDGGGGGFQFGASHLGIGGVLLVLAISYFTGVNPLSILNAMQGGGQTQTQTQTQTLPQAQTQAAPPQAAASGAPADAPGRFVAQILGSTEDVWTAVFKEQGLSYTAPTLVLFNGATQSGCGAAQSAMGPFYCPVDKKVYLDTEFFQEMRNRFNACPPGEGACAFAQAYVIAHEVGHHVQDLYGLLPKANAAEQAAGSGAQANAISVRVELQADCLAGIWANRAEQRWHFIQPGDVEAALQTANAIGDDMLEKKAQGYAVPDSFTHGTSAQRQRWFLNGYRSGQINACNTFQAQEL
jgi:predicted metalloprotease